MLQSSVEVTEDEFDKVFNVNVKSIFHVSPFQTSSQISPLEKNINL